MAYSTKEILLSTIAAFNSNMFSDKTIVTVITNVLIKYDRSSIHNNSELVGLWNELNNIHSKLTQEM